MLLAAAFVDSLGYGMTIPVLPQLVEARGSVAVLVGVLGSLYAVAQLAGMPLLGALSDRIGRKPVLLLGLAAKAAALVLLGLARGNAPAVAAVLLAGLASGSLTAIQAWAAEAGTDSGRVHRLALVGLAQGAGLLAGPALGGLLGAGSPRTPPLAAAALVAACAVVAAGMLAEPARRGRGRPAPGAAGAPSGRGVALRATLVVVALVNLSFAGLLLNLPLLTRARFDWGSLELGALFAAGGASAALTQGLLIGLLRRRLPEHRLVLAGTLTMALSLSSLGLAVRPWMLFAGVVLLAAAASTAIPSLTAIVTRQAPQDRSGAALGRMNAVVAATMAVAPIGVGLLYERVGTAAPYLLGGALALGACIVTALLLNRRSM